MENTIQSILLQYCQIQGIELKNMNTVVLAIEEKLDDVIPFIVHEVGEILEEDEED